ncbi:MAG: UvrD-helicase domain-containing protein [Pseudomonadota bacterium]
MKLPDEASRKIIETTLNSNLLVEAAAGTGKTWALVTRMIRLLEAGIVSVDRIAALTFTGKAAAEMRAGFQTELERNFARSGSRLLRNALNRLDECFIGTIHSFCARMLAERPVEAGVEIGFPHLDEAADEELKDRAWARFTDELHTVRRPQLKTLRELGIDPAQLREAYKLFLRHSDVPERPPEAAPAPNLSTDEAALDEMTERVEKLLSHLPEPPGNDKPAATFKQFAMLYRQTCWHGPADVMEFLSESARLSGGSPKTWPGGKEQGEVENSAWEEFREHCLNPLSKDFRQGFFKESSLGGLPEGVRNTRPDHSLASPAARRTGTKSL